MLSLSNVYVLLKKKKKFKIWRRNSRNAIITFWPKKINEKKLRYGDDRIAFDHEHFIDYQTK